MDADRVQEIHQAIFLHMTSEKYNFLEYNGRLRKPKPTTFSVRLSKWLNTEEQAIDFFLSNQIRWFLQSQKANSFIGNFCDMPSLETLKKFEGYKENLSYNMLSELKLLISLGEKVKDFSYICNLLYTGKVSFMTICNFNQHVHMEKYWKNDDDPLMEQVFFFMKKISNFVMIPKKNFVDAIKKAAQEV